MEKNYFKQNDRGIQTRMTEVFKFQPYIGGLSVFLNELLNQCVNCLKTFYAFIRIESNINCFLIIFELHFNSFTHFSFNMTSNPEECQQLIRELDDNEYQKLLSELQVFNTKLCQMEEKAMKLKSIFDIYFICFIIKPFFISFLVELSLKPSICR